MENRYLPIGSVVKIKDSQKRLMITGYLPIESSENGEKKIWDYCGCLYPEGMLTSTTNFLFNQDKIEEITFLGLEDEEEKEFQKKLEEQIKNINKN